MNPQEPKAPKPPELEQPELKLEPDISSWLQNPIVDDKMIDRKLFESVDYEKKKAYAKALLDKLPSFSIGENVEGHIDDIIDDLTKKGVIFDNLNFEHFLEKIKEKVDESVIQQNMEVKIFPMIGIGGDYFSGAYIDSINESGYRPATAKELLVFLRQNREKVGVMAENKELVLPPNLWNNSSDIDMDIIVSSQGTVIPEGGSGRTLMFKYYEGKKDIKVGTLGVARSAMGGFGGRQAVLVVKE